MATYFRRSRSGCLTCRALHTKCDERKPHCRRCSDRGSTCEGYAQRLRWVDAGGKTGDSIVAGPRQVLVVKRPISLTSLTAHRLLPYSIPQLDQPNQMLFEHWMVVTLQLACLDPTSSDSLRNIYLDLVCQHRFVALHAMLAGSAAHMLSLGLIPEHLFVSTRQRALESMILSLRSFTCNSSHVEPTGILETPLQGHHLPSSGLDDAAITGALLLLGPEIIHARDEDDFAHIRWLLQGAQSLIVERHKYFSCLCPLSHPASNMPQFRLGSPLFVSAVRCLAYTDIMACVPCARTPLIGKEYWLHDAMTASMEGARMMKPDMDLGYCAGILSLLADCTRAVEKLYLGSISEVAFSLSQKGLLERLDDAIQALPHMAEIGDDFGSGTRTTDLRMAHNHSVWAAISHALANQIFLLRATDFQRNSASIESLSYRLSVAISHVPIEHPAATIMLWPIWVLGCESYLDSHYASRQFVTRILTTAYESQRIMNIYKCLIRLKRDIWRIEPRCVGVESIPEHSSAGQPSWVRRCWDKRIEVLLA